MKCLRSTFRAAIAAALLTGGWWPAQAQTLAMPQGLTVELPASWHVDGPAEGRLGRDGLRRIHLACASARCAQAQEACTLLLRPQPLAGEDDGARLRSLYDSPLKKYARLRAVLRRASPGADLRQPLAIVRIGEREWYQVETDAAPGHAARLYAETVVGGHYVGAICSTLETAAPRHQDALSLLQSLQAVPTASR